VLKLLRMLRPFSVPVAAVLVIVFCQCMCDLYLPNLMSDIVNKGITNNDIEYITRTGLLMLGVALSSSICAVLASYLSSHISMGMGEAIRERIFRQVSGYSLVEFDKIGTPSLITRSTNDVTQVQNVLVFAMRMLIQAPITAVGGIILALQKDSGLAWIIVVVIPILGVIIGSIAMKGFPLFQAIQKKLDRINLILRENLTGIRVIRAFDRGESERKRFDEANADLTGTAVKVNRIFAAMMPSMMLVMNFTTLSIIWFGSKRVDMGSSNVGDMMAFLQYAMQILFSFIMASIMFIMIPRAQASAARINEALELESEIRDPESPRLPPPDRKGFVEFRGVSFTYHGAEEPAVRGVSFEARPGETTAIIGSTGSGKSTMLSLIPRFYDATEGEVLVDGLDVREMAQEDLRSRIGYVPQKAVLFTGTVAENIRHGKEDATDEEIRAAAKTAQALDFVSAMEQGFDSPIAQGGTNVSGGQKQRLSIARALVRRPEIYLFDDSFSALDFKTDAALRAALKRDTAGATVIIVGQRVATIMDADRIIVLDEGKIVGMGTHKELYETCGVYREIVASQLSEEEIA
jgi:ATP-binding cassette, subfamily B, multidrug efflux pump